MNTAGSARAAGQQPTPLAVPAQVENPDPLLTKAQLAAYLAVSERTARTLIEERRLDVVAIGRSIRVRRSTADRYLLACTQPAARACC